MLSNEKMLRVELDGVTRMEKLEAEPEPFPGPDPWDPYNCPNCRSGMVEFPEEIVVGLVTVKL